jgi:hypothetical protein
MTKAEELFIELTAQTPGAKPGRMFSALCMKMPNGKSGAMFWREHLVVKLQGELMEEALSLDGAKTFEPMEGRTMNGWIQVPYHYKTKWKKFAQASAAAVSLLEKNPPKKKK